MPVGDERLLRLVTWNVARRTAVIAEQAMALAEREPDVAALQEVTRRTAPLWRRAFEVIGLSHVRTSLDESATAGSAGSPRMGVMLASREPLHDVAQALEMPRPESALCAVTDSPLGIVELWTVHIPNAANGWVKPNSLRALRDGLTATTSAPRVVCGDLNTPRRELSDGKVMSFARDSRGRLRPDRGPEWDAAELGIVPGLRDLGYLDAFRSLHGYAAREPSWTWRQIAGHGGGWRLDHIFVSPELQPVGCVYHHEWRDRGLSDHSALEAELASRS
ncbi:MAG: endonuclease/exonuclease/phosphatase family protein [Actinomycetota bacterium]|nr:endonuclease/exonuclease/phosphatase family protein [Actinomycetota bacterium]